MLLADRPCRAVAGAQVAPEGPGEHPERREAQHGGGDAGRDRDPVGAVAQLAALVEEAPLLAFEAVQLALQLAGRRLVVAGLDQRAGRFGPLLPAYRDAAVERPDLGLGDRLQPRQPGLLQRIVGGQRRQLGDLRGERGGGFAIAREGAGVAGQEEGPLVGDRPLTGEADLAQGAQHLQGVGDPARVLGQAPDVPQREGGVGRQQQGDDADAEDDTTAPDGGIGGSGRAGGTARFVQHAGDCRAPGGWFQARAGPAAGTFRGIMRLMSYNG